MGLGSFKKLIGIEEIDDDEEVTEADIQEAKEKLSKETKTVSNTQSSTVSTAVPPIAGFDPSSVATKTERGTGSVPEKRFSVSNTSALKVVLIEPKGFEECPKLVDSLKAKKPVIINLEKLETEVARKIFDFLSGAIYAINGNVQKIANNIFIFTPENVSVYAQQDNTKQEKDSTNPWRA